MSLVLADPNIVFYSIRVGPSELFVTLETLTLSNDVIGLFPMLDQVSDFQSLQRPIVPLVVIFGITISRKQWRGHQDKLLANKRIF